MKLINGQLYGYSYELDTSPSYDNDKCFAVDTGTVFVLYKGVWYEQPGSFWAASIPESGNDLIGTSWEVGKIVPESDLLVFNAVDTGKRFISFNGKWYEQPVPWSAPAPAGAGLMDDAFIVNLTPTNPDMSGVMDKTGPEIRQAYEAGKRILFLVEGMDPLIELQTAVAIEVNTGDDTPIPSVNCAASFWYTMNGANVLLTILTDGYELENPYYSVRAFTLTPAGEEDPFIVTLTPTSQDFSGTMDKTVAEINAAFEAGRKIVFRVLTSATTYIEADCVMRGRNASEGNYPSFNAFVVDEQNSVLVYAFTGVAAVASANTYSTRLYSLTPMS